MSAAAHWLGCDVSTKKIALGVLRYDGRVDWDTIRLPPDLKGAQRNRVARGLLLDALDARWTGIDAAVIETPWAGGSASSWSLLSLAAVCAEAVQTARPGCIVLEYTAGTWKKDTVGHGNATKDEVSAHVAAAHGYTGGDQDVADALCMAECARERWWRDIEPDERQVA